MATAMSIPARAEIEVPRREHIAELDLPEALLLEEEEELERMLAERDTDELVPIGRPSALLDEDDELIGGGEDDFMVGGDLVAMEDDE